MTKRVYTNSKEKILSAAKTILMEEGVGRLSTDNLVAKSGMSKGGFFYNFKTKNAVIEALVESCMDEMVSTILEAAAKDKNPRGKTLRAFLNYALSSKSQEAIKLFRSFFEHMISNNQNQFCHTEFESKLVKPMFKEGLPKEFVVSTLLVLDGYWHNEIFGYGYLPAIEIKKLFKNLIKQTQ